MALTKTEVLQRIHHLGLVPVLRADSEGLAMAAAEASFRTALKIKYLPETYVLLAEERCKTRDVEGAKPMLERILRGRMQRIHASSP